MERELLERDAVEREPLARDPVERDAAGREAVEREPLERLVLRPEPEEEFALVNALRSLSKSFSACLLVREALRRSAPSAAVTSL